MSLPGFEELVALADARREPVSLIVAGGADPTVIEALRAATDQGWVRATLAGCAADIQELAAYLGVSLDGIELLESQDPCATAANRVREGHARLMMKGQVTTPALMRAVLDPERGLRTGRAIGQVVLMGIPRDRRRFLLADTGVMVQPDRDQKADLIRSTTAMARALGQPCPRVALVAASESVNPSLPGTVEAAELARLAEGGAFGDCVVQGPLSFDLAYAADAGDKKRIGGPVVGAADVMIFPDLTSANLTVKAIMYTAHCYFGGILCGATCPIVFMSRADTTATRLRSIALALALVDSVP